MDSLKSEKDRVSGYFVGFAHRIATRVAESPAPAQRRHLRKSHQAVGSVPRAIVPDRACVVVTNPVPPEYVPTSCLRAGLAISPEAWSLETSPPEPLGAGLREMPRPSLPQSSSRHGIEAIVRERGETVGTLGASVPYGTADPVGTAGASVRPNGESYAWLSSPWFWLAAYARRDFVCHVQTTAES